MKRRDTKEALLEAAEHFFLQDQNPTVREIASRADVAIGMLAHHFNGYPGLIAALTRRLNETQAKELEKKFEVPRGRSQLDIAVAFFLELARLDLDLKYHRLRRMGFKMSWDWSVTDESMLAGSFTRLLEPLRKQLKFESDVRAEDLLMTLWAIYLLPLRLAMNRSLLPPSKEATIDNLVWAIAEDIRSKFALILKSK